MVDTEGDYSFTVFKLILSFTAQRQPSAYDDAVSRGQELAAREVLRQSKLEFALLPTSHLFFSLPPTQFFLSLLLYLFITDERKTQLCQGQPQFPEKEEHSQQESCGQNEKDNLGQPFRFPSYPGCPLPASLLCLLPSISLLRKELLRARDSSLESVGSGEGKMISFISPSFPTP